jgi:phosphonate transport system permease protein
MSIENTPSIDELSERYPQVFRQSTRQRAITISSWLAFFAFTVYTAWVTGFFDFQAIWTGLFKLGDVLGFMLPPAHNGWFNDFLDGIFETLAMAFIGTLLASLFAIPLGFLGAKNVLPSWLLHFSLRRVFDGLRGIDQLIWALVFVNVVGLGPFAGILAIAVADTGTLAKLFAEAIENIDERPVEGVESAGAGPVRTIRFSIVPQVLPVILSQTLYFFESNTRSATILGVVGAGGIGLHLSDRIRVNNWDEASFIIIMILVTVALIDRLSRWIRERFIGKTARA